ncbi:MAG: hypothetical protein QE285_02330 [Aquabacterium sp.]|nr:hypothetical protein [Aquabacterium sp.]
MNRDDPLHITRAEGPTVPGTPGDLAAPAVASAPAHGVGASLRRKEDARLLAGRGQFVADIRLPGMLDVAFVRSPVAHARLLQGAENLARLQADAALAVWIAQASVDDPYKAGYGHVRVL